MGVPFQINMLFWQSQTASLRGGSDCQRSLSLRTSAHAGVAIRSLKCYDFCCISTKLSIFSDADSHVALLLGMTDYRLVILAGVLVVEGAPVIFGKKNQKA